MVAKKLERDDGPDERDFLRPLDRDAFRPLEPTVEKVSVGCSLKPREWERLAALMSERPAVDLHIWSDATAGDLKFLQLFPFLKRLRVELYWNTVRRIGEQLPANLQWLWLVAQRNSRMSMAELSALGKLRTFALEGQVKEFERIAALPRIERLWIQSVTLPNLQALVPLSKLKWLAIKLGGTSNLAHLGDLRRLEYLELWRISGPTDLSELARCAALREVFLDQLRHVRKLPSLRNCENLTRFCMNGTTNLLDLRPLTTAPNLREFELSGDAGLNAARLRPLLKVRNLSRVTIHARSKERAMVAELLPFPDVSQKSLRNRFWR
ncbi:MAG: hypothetical protein SF069_10040 [Phycisphaerae bacterium]|nr:hypothetical protein [Phycisphaerae bacterium]